MKLFFLIVFSSLALIAGAQTKSPADETARLQELLKQHDGTFQIQVLNSRDKTEFPLAILDQVVLKRSATDTVYLPLKNNVRLMILPLNVISQKKFIPLPRIANIWL